MGLLDLLSLQNILLLNVFVFVLYLCYMSRKFLTFRKMGVQGPTPIPVMGTMLPLFKHGMIKVVGEYYAKYKDVGFYGTFEGDQPSLVVCNLDSIREIAIKQFGNFTNHRTFEAIDSFPMNCFLNNMKDDHWKHVRNHLTPAFSTGKLRRMMPLIEDCCQELVEAFQKAADSGADVEIKTMLGGFTMDVIGRTAFGLQTDTQKNPDNMFVKSAKAFFDVGGAVIAFFFFMPFLAPVLKLIKYQSVAKEYIDFFVNVTVGALKERQQDTSGKYRDFMQLMANAEVNPADEVDADIDHRAALTTSTKWTNRGLTKEDIVGTGILFLVAGYETTATTLCFCVHLLAVNPECQEKARQEVDEVLQGSKPTSEKLAHLNYLEMCLLETLRLYPPAGWTDRLCNEETVVNGLTIPKGMVVGFPIVAIHRDPEYWPEPDKFDPERFTTERKADRHPMSFLPFGAGPRNCIGMRLALMEAKMALAAILQKFNVVPGEKTENPITLNNLGITTAKNGFWLKAENRT